MGHLQGTYQVSERRACRVLKVWRSVQRYVPQVQADEPVILHRMTEIAQTRVRYGDRRIHVLMSREGWRINHKRLYRLYQQAGLNLRMKRPRRRVSAAHRAARTTPEQANQVWSLAFVSDALFNGKRFRTLTLIDVFTRECLAIHADVSLRAERVVEVVTEAARHRGRPERIQVDNGSEFVSKALDLWAYEQGVTLDFSRPGKPQDNAHIESFNGSFRDECLNAHWFLSMEDAAEKIERWRSDDNQHRPHSALGNLAPGAFAAQVASVHRPPCVSNLTWPKLGEHLRGTLEVQLDRADHGGTLTRALQYSYTEKSALSSSACWRCSPPNSLATNVEITEVRLMKGASEATTSDP